LAEGIAVTEITLAKRFKAISLSVFHPLPEMVTLT
jgi:hypothetical protein